MVVFAYVTYESREKRDEANAKIMADPRFSAMDMRTTCHSTGCACSGAGSRSCCGPEHQASLSGVAFSRGSAWAETGAAMTEAVRVVRVKVTGRVQGVGYRAWTAETARELGLNGWVRNLTGGGVEALFAGPPHIVAAMLERCHDGPWAARVTAVEIAEEGGLAPQGFDILRTA